MVNIKYIGRCEYQSTWDAMQLFTASRTSQTIDEFWIVEHHPVYTLGKAGKIEHILCNKDNIDVVVSDRGGQVTYHGPGQIVIYLLINWNKLNISVRELVLNIEQGIINYLKLFNLNANGDREAPGVYIDGKKIASIGLKISKGCTYHGISLNYNMNLAPFSDINVCGYSNLKVVQLADLVNISNLNIKDESLKLANCISETIYKII